MEEKYLPHIDKRLARSMQLMSYHYVGCMFGRYFCHTLYLIFISMWRWYLLSVILILKICLSLLPNYTLIFTNPMQKSFFAVVGNENKVFFSFSLITWSETNFKIKIFRVLKRLLFIIVAVFQNRKLNQWQVDYFLFI